jgi:hypothetical protein
MTCRLSGGDSSALAGQRKQPPNEESAVAARPPLLTEGAMRPRSPPSCSDSTATAQARDGCCSPITTASALCCSPCVPGLPRAPAPPAAFALQAPLVEVPRAGAPVVVPAVRSAGTGSDGATARLPPGRTTPSRPRRTGLAAPRSAPRNSSSGAPYPHRSVPRAALMIARHGTRSLCVLVVYWCAAIAAVECGQGGCVLGSWSAGSSAVLPQKRPLVGLPTRRKPPACQNNLKRLELRR